VFYTENRFCECIQIGNTVQNRHVFEFPILEYNFQYLNTMP